MGVSYDMNKGVGYWVFTRDLKVESSGVITSCLSIIESSSIMSFFDLDNPVAPKSKTIYRKIRGSFCFVSLVSGLGRGGNTLSL